MYFPEGLEYVNITTRGVIFGFMSSKGSINNIETVSVVNLTGILSDSPGIHSIQITSTESGVSISE